MWLRYVLEWGNGDIVMVHKGLCMCLQRYLAVGTVHGAVQDITPPENRGYSDAASVDVA